MPPDPAENCNIVCIWLLKALHSRCLAGRAHATLHTEADLTEPSLKVCLIGLQLHQRALQFKSELFQSTSANETNTPTSKNCVRSVARAVNIRSPRQRVAAASNTQHHRLYEAKRT